MHDSLTDIAGLEVVLLEDSGSDDRTALFDSSSVLWYATFGGEEPQNAAIGEFDTSRAGLEVWNRSGFEDDQHPWVFGADGLLIADWELNDTKPAAWSTESSTTFRNKSSKRIRNSTFRSRSPTCTDSA